MIAVGPATNALSTAKNNNDGRPNGAVTPYAQDRNARALFGGNDDALFDGQEAGGAAFGPGADNAFGLQGLQRPSAGVDGFGGDGGAGSAFNNGAPFRMGGGNAGNTVASGVYGYLAGGNFGGGSVGGGGSFGGAAVSPGAPDGSTGSPAESGITTPADTAVTVPAPGALGLLAVGLLGVAAAARCRRSETRRG